ncbi:MAG: nicotinate mononucleotide-dependent phosphoribosyltransferase CobT, partial [Cyanobacteria bacterium P01_F01_bin.153]
MNPTRKDGGMGHTEAIPILRYGDSQQGGTWLDTYRSKKPHFLCVVAFTETALVPGISAAGATPSDRRITALADLEFLINGPRPDPQYSLPPLTAGVSPAVISRALLSQLEIPIHGINAGLARSPTVDCFDLKGAPARCLSTGAAMDRDAVQGLFNRAWLLGDALGQENRDGYLILSECVVGGTSTALAVLLGLGINSDGLVNSSHPQCNHQQKLHLVRQGLERAQLPNPAHPRDVVAAVGDPMQVAVAAMALAASAHTGVLLGGGTQMLTVYALAHRWAAWDQLNWNPEAIAIGTTRWVTADVSAKARQLPQRLIPNNPDGPPFFAADLDFSTATIPALQVYEQGFVKEGVGAGASAIAASLYGNL